jgi:hypothetical protein
LLTVDDAERFAREWVAAWNAHDADLRAYYARALEAYPDLHFVLHAALTAFSGVAIHYRSVGGREAIEVLELNAAGLIERAAAYYSEPADA